MYTVLVMDRASTLATMPRIQAVMVGASPRVEQPGWGWICGKS